MVKNFPTFIEPEGSC